ncbi:TolC family outer membrane protein [Sulfurimonas sp.]|uniref:TolC family outer membrane protein n=1 Tax=Sulfurimonas sp. TaxID=2022749 RepID=UPI00263387D4|nr:TolC family outer membrane protein [Sulfurimonas sp.]MCW8896127.1 TolC family outer membrane protein [Sulfurimonas sp.]
MNKTILLAVLLATAINAQDLKTTVNEVLSTNPIILERLKNYNATKEDITTAKAGYYPKLDLSIGVGREDGETAAGQDFDYSVYQNSLTYTHNIFKGFETTYRVKQQESRTASAAYSYIEKVNDTSFEMVNTYLQVMKNKELLNIERENIEINAEILAKVQKLYDSGLTTLSEVNKIESSLSLAKSNYIVQENTMLDVKYNMQRVLGRYIDPDEMSRPVLNVALPASLEEATLFAMQNNPSLLVGKHNVKLAQATYQEKKSPFYPSVDIEVSQNMNKNLSGIPGEYDNLRAMAYLRYNFFNGFADKATLQKSVSTIHQEVQTKNQLRREVIEGLSLSWAANEKLSKQLEHLKDYKNFSIKTLTLYSKEYDLGRRSLLDLLSAQNDFIAAKAQIINTEYSMLFAKYRILDAMGTLVSTINEDTDTIYSNVGLAGKTPENMDSLPISYDNDNDLIVDEMDICNNSLSDKMRNLYGCEFTFNDTQRIERYSGFLFNNESYELTDDGTDRLNDLIKQMKPYGWENLKFDILGNVDSQDMTKEEMHNLSKQRAQAIKDKLILAGAIDVNIVIHAQEDKAPMFSKESNQSSNLNNRADIIVRKLKK